jgi:Fe-S cluster biogenesis protein NfuA
MQNLNKAELKIKVNEAIEQLRPFLHADGGDMELIDITDEAVVQVRLLGSCSDCSMSMMTLKAGLEDAVKKIAPEIQAVEAVQIDSINQN